MTLAQHIEKLLADNDCVIVYIKDYFAKAWS